MISLRRHIHEIRGIDRVDGVGDHTAVGIAGLPVHTVAGDADGWDEGGIFGDDRAVFIRPVQEAGIRVRGGRDAERPDAVRQLHGFLSPVDGAVGPGQVGDVGGCPAVDRVQIGRSIHRGGKREEIPAPVLRGVPSEEDEIGAGRGFREGLQTGAGFDRHAAGPGIGMEGNGVCRDTADLSGPDFGKLRGAFAFGFSDRPLVIGQHRHRNFRDVVLRHRHSDNVERQDLKDHGNDQIPRHDFDKSLFVHR